ncbi:translation initiation factor eIF-6 [Pyrolobus fumarii 1A]|uniref:Translation initiation factor 6 n=1 Tax=Pyrolobus fumarii (strain DSM 11204 / 1A) TaxID=694429 RepID=G0EEM8_PYRF1|nr:translation initiation factor IF-6 [Pyrolobus fumarii]AEM38850.1 translation initiation factor eIF-6 [Pyrolobus fumarii 1A]
MSEEKGAIEKISIFGNSNIGVYIFANNKFALVPPGVAESDKKRIRDTLGVDIIEVKIADMIINGVMVAGNDRGLLLPRIVKPEEIDELKSYIGGSVRIEVLNIRSTALGNLIAANNNGALVSPLVDRTVLEIVRDVLGVPRVEMKRLADIPSVGSMLVANSYGGLVHPGVSDEEIEFLQSVFGVEFIRGTVNFGLYFVKAGIVANDNGVLVGEDTTGPEIAQISQALLPR